MVVNQLIEEDFVNYKKPSLYVGLPYCSFKCDKEQGLQVCQNSILASSLTIDVEINSLIKRYMDNPITESIVFAGLEPFDSFDDLLDFTQTIRSNLNDDIVIYTGYYENEITKQINILKQYKNIIVKFGRYIPNQQSHYDDVLGVYLASDNQYAKKIS